MRIVEFELIGISSFSNEKKQPSHNEYVFSIFQLSITILGGSFLQLTECCLKFVAADQKSSGY